MNKEIKDYLIPAYVEDNDDTNHTDGKNEGRVKISIAHLTSGFDVAHLPWVRPFELGTGGNGSYGKSNIPEIGSYIWVFFYDPKHLKQGFYLANVNFADINPHTFFNDTIKRKIGSAGTYPNVKWHSYKNQITIGVDSSDNNPEIFLYHPKGSSIFIDKDGQVNLISGGNITIDSGGNELLLKTGDASTWSPCIIKNCLFTSAPHGGDSAGIINLKGS